MPFAPRTKGRAASRFEMRLTAAERVQLSEDADLAGMSVSECGGPVCSDRFFGFLSGIIARRNRGGGNVKISFIDFQGLWEGRETALSFSALSTDRHFHGRLRCALCRPC